MTPSIPTPPRVFVLLWAALALLACEPLRDNPEPPKPPPLPPDPPVLTVTLESAEPVYCREGQQVTIAATIEGGTPESVSVLVTDTWGTTRAETLPAPYRYTKDCSTGVDGTYSFVVRASAGGRSFESPSKAVTVDRREPYILEWRPRTAFPGVTEPVEIVFSEPIDPRSIGAVPALLRNGSGFSVAHQVVLAEGGTVLRLVPSQPLVPPITLRAELLPETKPTDLAGNPLSISGVISRSFEYWPFARFGPAPSEASIDWADFLLTSWPKQFERVFAWTEAMGGESELVVAHWDGAAWARLPLPRAEAERHGGAYEPKVAVGGEGRLVVAWREGGIVPERLVVKRFDGTAWQSLGSPSGALKKDDHLFGYMMALDGNGDPVLAWADFDEIHVARWDGTGWNTLGGPLRANPRGHTAQAPAIAVGSGNHVVVAWSEDPLEEGSRRRVHVREYRDGAWSALGTPFSGGGADSFSLDKVALALDGLAPIVVWNERLQSPENGVIYFSRWDTRGWWSAPELVQGVTDAYSLSAPKLVIDSRGTPWVAWHRQGSDRFGWKDIVYRRRSASGWEPAQLVAGGALVGFEVDDLGYPWVAVWRSWAPEAVALLRPQ